MTRGWADGGGEDGGKSATPQLVFTRTFQMRNFTAEYIYLLTICPTPFRLWCYRRPVRIYCSLCINRIISVGRTSVYTDANRYHESVARACITPLPPPMGLLARLPVLSKPFWWLPRHRFNHLPPLRTHHALHPRHHPILRLHHFRKSRLPFWVSLLRHH